MQDFKDLLRYERHRPGENVHEIGEYEWMVGIIVLLDLDGVIFKLKYGCFVVVNITVVRGREDGNDGGELLGSVPLMELESIHLDLVSSHDAQKIIVFKEIVCGFTSEDV